MSQLTEPPHQAAFGAGGREPISVDWSGSPWRFVGLGFANFFLSIITLGIYSFWGRTEVRRRIWSSIRLQGEPLAYTGTGKELFPGFLFAILVLFVPTVIALTAAAIAFGPRSLAYNLTAVGVYALYFMLMGVAIYRARRYRLSRTAWRGIRGGMCGSSGSFAWLWVWTALLVPLTLGWIGPWRANRLQSRLNGETTFGDQQFTYAGTSSRLYGPFAVLWVGGIVLLVGVLMGIGAILGPNIPGAGQNLRPPTPEEIAALVAIVSIGFLALSIVGAWYHSRSFNLFASFTGFDQAKLRLRTTTPGLIGLFLTNFLITVLSVGILSPVAKARSAKYFVDRLSLDGTVDVAAILQSRTAPGRGGEGLAQMFEVDAI